MSTNTPNYTIYDTKELPISFTTYYITTNVPDDPENKDPLNTQKLHTIINLVSEHESKLHTIRPSDTEDYVELGPSRRFNSPWTSNALNVLHTCNIMEVINITKTTSYKTPPNYYDKMTTEIYTPQSADDELIKAPPSPTPTPDVYDVNPTEISAFSDKYGLALDKADIEYYQNIFQNRPPTNVELFDLAQSNSEHSRHWFFNGKLDIDPKTTLFKMIKAPLKANPANSLVAFSDNASVIKGYPIQKFSPINPWKSSPYHLTPQTINPSLTAETHNFPTGVSPFPGAATGVGGRLRDSQSVGRGGQTVYGIAGYSVGNLHLPKYQLPQEISQPKHDLLYSQPHNILIDASNGASDYGNKYGEPLIQGYTRTYGATHTHKETHIPIIQQTTSKRSLFKKSQATPPPPPPAKTHYEYIKPIMFSGGISYVLTQNLKKLPPKTDQYIVRLGGPVYPIGVGGGSASSRSTSHSVDYSAVQRGDPQMENRLNNVIRAAIELPSNPILSIHDQGAGGMANVTKEIVEPLGANIDLTKVHLSSPDLTTLEIWTSEHQEQNTVLTNKKGYHTLLTIAKRESCPIERLGITNSSGTIKVKRTPTSTPAVNLELSKVLTNVPQKSYTCHPYPEYKDPFPSTTQSYSKDIKNILKHPTVSSKRYLTNKVDRSVTGLIAQQQEVGPLLIPISDYASSALDYFTTKGTVTSVAERPIISLLSPANMAAITLGELLTNIMTAKITALQDIKISTNWMWPLPQRGAKTKLHEAMTALTTLLTQLKIAADGGKDSLSMMTKTRDNKQIISPPTLVLTAYATTDDINQKVTPQLHPDHQLYLIDLSGSTKLNNRMGASIYAQISNTLGTPANTPSFNITSSQFTKIFNTIQYLIQNKVITAGHDRSDGGLITTLLEMAFTGNVGIEIDLQHYASSIADPCLEINFITSLLFNEELGLVIEVPEYKTSLLQEAFEDIELTSHLIPLGSTTTEKIVSVSIDKETIISELLFNFYEPWEETSHQLSKLQTTPQCVDQERNHLSKMSPLTFTYTPEVHTLLTLPQEPSKTRPPAIILRDEGSNGFREMAAAFYAAGFLPIDLTTTDLINRADAISRHTTPQDANIFDNARTLVFTGGFSRADVFGAANSWYHILQSHPIIKQQLEKFRTNPRTIALGVCNGCQLMTRLNWLGKGVTLIQNKSKKFESRYTKVKILPDTNSVFLTSLANSTAGIHVAHGEGRFFLDRTQLTSPEHHRPIRYVDEHDEPTEKYPINPNGSIDGTAAVSSPDGRFLAMMPHPERAFLPWQEHYNNNDTTTQLYGFWHLLFRNAYDHIISSS